MRAGAVNCKHVWRDRWLPAALSQRGVGFCMRVKRACTGFACVREFLHSGLAEAVLKLNAPDQRDCTDYECPPTPANLGFQAQTGGIFRLQEA